MKAHHPGTFPQRPFSKVIVACLLLFLLAACGSNSVAGGAPPTSTRASGAPHPKTGFPLALNARDITLKAGNLLIQSTGGFQCPSVVGPSSMPGQLTFASGRTTYSQAEIAQMRTYMDKDIVNGRAGIASPPPTLRWILGGTTDKIPGAAVGFTDCGGLMTLTNTGTTPIQIPEVGVELQVSPQQNTYQYRLINICSVVPIDPNAVYTGCPPPGGGGGSCNFYEASISLGLGGPHTEFSAVPSATSYGSGPCGPLTLAPASEVDLDITFPLAANTPKNLLYSIVPVFTIDTDQGEQTLTLTQLRSTLAYASVSQFSCYKLQGTTFVQEQAPFPRLTWCL